MAPRLNAPGWKAICDCGHRAEAHADGIGRCCGLVTVNARCPCRLFHAQVAK